MKDGDPAWWSGPLSLLLLILVLLLLVWLR